jgi:hypothetical protein
VTVKRIRKKSGETESILYDGTNAAEIIVWSYGHAYQAEGELYIITDRKDVAADIGDHIVRGLVGEYYPITPESYAAGWEEVGS